MLDSQWRLEVTQRDTRLYIFFFFFFTPMVVLFGHHDAYDLLTSSWLRSRGMNDSLERRQLSDFDQRQLRVTFPDSLMSLSPPYLSTRETDLFWAPLLNPAQELITNTHHHHHSAPQSTGWVSSTHPAVQIRELCSQTERHFG